MADDKSKRGEEDRIRINMQENYEVRYWTHRLGVYKEQLGKAVNEVGTSAVAVRKELRKRS